MKRRPIVYLSNMRDRRVIVRVPRKNYERDGIYCVRMDPDTCGGLSVEVLPWEGRRPHVTSWEPQNKFPVRTALTIGQRMRLLLGRFLSDRKA